MSRYLRQIAVPELGAEGHELLRNAHVLVVGAGGLGAPVLQYLAGAGVCRIRLVDPDRADLSNLHRQTLFRESDLGQPKAAAAAATLHALNPDCRIEALHTALRPANVAALCDGVNLVLDCADSFAVSYILSDHCFDAGLPLISASVTGLSGHVGAFCAGAPSLRAVFPDLPQRAGSCAEDGVLGPVVGTIGTLQAQMALHILGRITPSPLGRFITYDAQDFRFGGFRFMGAPEPDHAPRFIDPSAICDTDFIVDLRSADEGPLAHQAALRLTADDLTPTGPKPANSQRAVLCCRSGLRAWTAAEKLAAHWRGPIALVAFGDPTGDPE